VVEETGWPVESRQRKRLALSGLVVLVLVLVASAGWVWTDHRNDTKVTAAYRGHLTPSQYAAAVEVARHAVAHLDGTVTAAVATLVKARPADCNEHGMLLVQVVGHFNLAVTVSPGAHYGPDQWVVARANPADAVVCSGGVSLGKFKAPPGAANLLPAVAANMLPAL
jgi:hypothetical protein